MSILLFGKRQPPTPGAEPKARNKAGIKSIYDRALLPGAKVTLEQAIAILKAGW